MNINFFEAFKVSWPVAIGLFLLFVVILVGLAFLASLESRTARYRYLRKESIMTRSEVDFFNILFDAIGGQYHVFVQVHLDAILDHKVRGQSWFGAFRHINEKSVDFVICDKADIKPLLAIELDDRSHEQEDRRERDGEVERILGEAGLPLLRFANHGHFNKEEIKRLVLEKIT